MKYGLGFTTDWRSSTWRIRLEVNQQTYYLRKAFPSDFYQSFIIVTRIKLLWLLHIPWVQPLWNFMWYQLFFMNWDPLPGMLIGQRLGQGFQQSLLRITECDRDLVCFVKLNSKKIMLASQWGHQENGPRGIHVEKSVCEVGSGSRANMWSAAASSGENKEGTSSNDLEGKSPFPLHEYWWTALDN